MKIDSAAAIMPRDTRDMRNFTAAANSPPSPRVGRAAASPSSLTRAANFSSFSVGSLLIAPPSIRVQKFAVDETEHKAARRP